MYVDMPPGTGDVPLTVFQSLPVDGIVVVTTPQDAVAMIVEKAVRMAEMMDVRILGIVENMSYVTCLCCGAKFYPYGESRTRAVAQKYSIPLLGSLPIEPGLAALVDGGRVEEF